jgi:hypothetical protein
MQGERMRKAAGRKQTHRKDYSAPVLQKREKLSEVTRGAGPAVS